MEENKPLTVAEFAELKKIPTQAVLDALAARRIIPMDKSVEDFSLCTIHPDYLETFKIELIGVYEYADRKRVTWRAVYKKIDKGEIPYYLDSESNAMKIDWVQQAGVHFRKFGMKHRGKKLTN